MAAWRPRPDWLRTAVETALDEDSCRLELVVVDDGSPEPVAPLLADLVDDRVRVVRVPHGGVSRARNAGIAAARGEFLRFVDADDALAPGSTGRLLALADESTIAYGATAFCDADLRPLWTMRCRLEGDVVEDCLLGRFKVRVPALLFPAAVVQAAGEWDPGFRVSEDWEWTLRAVEHARVRGDGEIALRYRKHGASATADASAGLDGARLVVQSFFERRHDLRGSSLERRAEAMLEAHAARVLATRGRVPQALGRAARAALLDPRALTGELARSAPALRAAARKRVRPRTS